MPIFARRRQQGMLDDLGNHLSDSKARDLLNRLNNKRIEQALPAEMELALLWGLLQIGELEVEPDWWGDQKRPDAYTESLVPGRPAIVEIAAVTDNRISGEEAMDRVAREISNYANTIRRGVGDFLHFSFEEESGLEGRTYFRRRLAPPNYALSPSAAELGRSWLASVTANQLPLRIQEPGLDVVVEKKEHKQVRYHNVFSSMPPETHSVDDNPLYDALRSKLSQLQAAQPETLRYIFTADVGSTLLRRIGRAMEIDHTGRSISGREIVSNFVHQYRDRVDTVVVFAPRRDQSMMSVSHNPLTWAISVFNRPGLTLEHPGLRRLLGVLPLPRFEGYQARSLFQQGSFSPTRPGWYVGRHIQDDGKGKMKMKVSSRALLDLLAGRITPARFRYAVGERPGDVNLIEHWLKSGMTLSSVEMERTGLDQDDDFLVLTFADDPSARELRPTRKDTELPGAESGIDNRRCNATEDDGSVAAGRSPDA